MNGPLGSVATLVNYRKVLAGRHHSHWPRQSLVRHPAEPVRQEGLIMQRVTSMVREILNQGGRNFFLKFFI